MAFPESALGLRGELLLGGTWRDITPDLYTREPIQVTHGQAPGGGQPDPAACSLLLNNASGKYSPRNPAGPYFGLLGRNTPARITVPGLESYLALTGAAGTGATTPYVPALGITGDLDVRVEATADWWAPGMQTLVGRWSSSGNQRSWMLALVDGAVQLRFSVDGTTAGGWAGLALPTLPRRAALRATLDVDNGAGGWTARLYWATSLDGPWAQIGADLVAPGTTVTVNAGTAPLMLSPTSAVTPPYWLPITGRIHRAEVRSGIGGTVVAAPDIRALDPGVTGFTDATGRVWSVPAPAEITDSEGLFYGEVAEWPPRWSPGEHDAWVPVSAAGILRRLGQGRRPLQSTLRRRIPSEPTLIAYWPMEDGEGATQLYSPLDGVRPLKVTGMDLAADSSLPGSAPLPTLGDTATLSAAVPKSAVSGWQVEAAYHLPTLPSVQTELLRVTVTGSAMRSAHVFVGAAGVRVEARNADGDTLASYTVTDGTALADLVGQWNRVQIYTTTPATGQARITAAWRSVSTGTWWRATTLITGAMGSATGIVGQWGSATQGMVLGHLAVFAAPGTDAATPLPAINIFDGADRAFTGETAVTRLIRLGREEPTLRLTTVDGDVTAESERMGPQGQTELMTLVGEVVETDGGVLYERMDRLGLVYRDRATLYNQAPTLVLDYAVGQVAPPLEPTDDDSDIRNDVTVSRAGGSSGRAVVEEGPLSVLDPEHGGVGVYEEAVTLSLGSDSQPQQIAAWRAHLGTWDEARYPSVRVLLHRRPELIPAVLALRPGDLIRITNPPLYTGPGPLDLIVRQIQHQPRPRAWEVTFVCTPAGPYRVGVVGDDALGRADTAGSVLAASVSATATVLSVTTTGPRWVTAAPNLLPDAAFESGVGGWACTRGATIGTVTPETGVVHSGRSAARITRVHPTDTGTLNIGDTTGVLPAAAGQTWAGSAWVNSNGASVNAMRVALVWRSAAGAESFIYGTAQSISRANGWTLLTVSAVLPAGAVAARLGIEGRSAWTVGEWWVVDDVRLARTDTLVGPDSFTDFPFEVSLGGETVRVQGVTGVTPTQTFYVTRAVNGITKPQWTGTDLRLATPTTVAL